MTRVAPAVLVLVLACLFTLSSALPSVLAQMASTQTEPNAPRTLLGKPYRRRWDSHDSPPNNGWSQTKANTEPRGPLPLVLNTLNFPGSEPVPARLRLMRLKRPLRYGPYGPCSDDVPLFGQARSDGMTPTDKDEQHVQPLVAFRTERRIGSREVSVRSRRLYDKGEWKSRLFEEY